MTWFQKDVQKREFVSDGSYQTIQFAFSTPNTSGSTQLVGAQGAGIRIIVLQLLIVTSNNCSVKFQSAATDISAQWALSPNGGFVMPYSRHGWFQTNLNEALNVNLNAAVSTGIQITWVPSV